MTTAEAEAEAAKQIRFVAVVHGGGGGGGGSALDGSMKPAAPNG